MKIIKTHIADLKLIEPTVYQDERGYFLESYNQSKLAKELDAVFVQDNEAQSSYGTIRGLHYQVGPSAQAKLVRVISGEVLDVAVDIRPGSDTYGEVFSTILSGENKRQLFVPKGFAHGYSVLSDEAIFVYKCDNYYDPTAEGGINIMDQKLAIDWKIDLDKAIISPKDRQQADFGNHRSF